MIKQLFGFEFSGVTKEEIAENCKYILKMLPDFSEKSEISDKGTVNSLAEKVYSNFSKCICNTCKSKLDKKLPSLEEKVKFAYQKIVEMQDKCDKSNQTLHPEESVSNELTCRIFCMENHCLNELDDIFLFSEAECRYPDGSDTSTSHNTANESIDCSDEDFNLGISFDDSLSEISFSPLSQSSPKKKQISFNLKFGLSMPSAKEIGASCIVKSTESDGKDVIVPASFVPVESHIMNTQVDIIPKVEAINSFHEISFGNLSDSSNNDGNTSLANTSQESTVSFANSSNDSIVSFANSSNDSTASLLNIGNDINVSLPNTVSIPNTSNDSTISDENVSLSNSSNDSIISSVNTSSDCSTCIGNYSSGSSTSISNTSSDSQLVGKNWFKLDSLDESDLEYSDESWSDDDNEVNFDCDDFSISCSALMLCNLITVPEPEPEDVEDEFAKLLTVANVEWEAHADKDWIDGTPTRVSFNEVVGINEWDDTEETRKSPWVEVGVNRMRFNKRIEEVDNDIGWIFDSAHRDNIFTSIEIRGAIYLTEKENTSNTSLT